MKMSITNSIDVVSYCQFTFGFQSVREQVLRRKINGLVKPGKCQNSPCSCLSADREASEAIIVAHTAKCVGETLTLTVFLGLPFVPLTPISNQAYAYLRS